MNQRRSKQDVITKYFDSTKIAHYPNPIVNECLTASHEIVPNNLSLECV